MMDPQHLSRYFPLDPTNDDEIIDAQQEIRTTARALAETLNRLLPESQSKVEMLMQLMHLSRNAQMSIELDGISRTRPMVVMN